VKAVLQRSAPERLDNDGTKPHPRTGAACNRPWSKGDALRVQVRKIGRAHLQRAQWTVNKCGGTGAFDTPERDLDVH